MTDQQLTKQREQIAALLKSRRQYLQLTQEQVAEKTGGKLSARTIQRGEYGYPLGENQLIQWCNALEINLANIMTSHVVTSLAVAEISPMK